MKKPTFLILLISFVTMTSCIQKKQTVDLIVYNAAVYTLDTAFSKSTAFAVDKGKFVSVGQDATILADFESTQKLDAGGKPVYPGFNDGHSHFMGYGLALTQYANLVGLTSFDDLLAALQKFHKDYPDHWILGRGWDQNLWEIKEFPDNTRLDAIFPKIPVVLIRIDGHAVLANSAALAIAGIDKNTSIAGGEIILKNGKPTGVLLDNAADRMKGFIPKTTDIPKINALMLAQKNCFAKGLTTVTDAGLDKEDILLIDSLQKAGQLQMKVYAMLSPTKENLDYFFPKGPLHEDRLTVSGVKLYADGALGSRGALLLKPYSDDPGNPGLQMEPASYYDSLCRLAYENGFQVNTHAIGDSANRLVLDVYGAILKGKNDLRWRIEHAQIVNADDMHKFGKFSVIPSIQSTHCTSDMDWADERVGPDRIKEAYPYKQLLEENGWLVNGTDFPIEVINPLYTFYAAVTRKHLDGTPDAGFQMENALTRKEALYSITLWPARGSFDEDRKGSIEAGKDADFVMLDHDVMTIEEQDITGISVKGTWINGKKVFE
ncbi:MAG: amidohydrolase [Bacteroidetes bacterium GWF2_41_31]|nr:MAG: amidohydrolase [Bacteroidetes bacterium GWF2_41_31]